MKLFDKLNIKVNNIKLYETALTHTSYTNETKEDNYERLEYLGDSVLQLVVTDYLYKKYPDMLEGEMTKVRAKYVCENANYQYSTSLGLNEYLKLGHGEEINGGKNKVSIVADIFESFIGAMYLDSGYEITKEFIYKVVINKIETGNVLVYEDYKSLLQEYIQSDKRSLVYTVISETGPGHHKVFTVNVSIDGIIYGTGTSSTKKEAEQEAARNALKKGVLK